MLVMIGLFLAIHGRGKTQNKDACVSLHVYHLEQFILEMRMLGLDTAAFFAAHFGGVFVMIKSVIQTVYDQFKNPDINEEELLSAFTGTEGLINSRPLTYQSADVHDVTPIAPNHVLFGQLGGQLAPEVEEQIYYDLKRRWRYVQLLVQQFWRCCILELVATLHQSEKWQSVR